jgi:hypothetical protein
MYERQKFVWLGREEIIAAIAPAGRFCLVVSCILFDDARLADQQIRQLGDVDGDAPRFTAGHDIGADSGKLTLKIDRPQLTLADIEKLKEATCNNRAQRSSVLYHARTLRAFWGQLEVVPFLLTASPNVRRFYQNYSR